MVSWSFRVRKNIPEKKGKKGWNGEHMQYQELASDCGPRVCMTAAASAGLTRRESCWGEPNEDNGSDSLLLFPILSGMDGEVKKPPVYKYFF